MVPIPKNIYGVTKLAAEQLCKLFHRKHGLQCLILRTSRFFPEADDSKNIREAYSDANSKVNEFLNRRCEIEDIVSAHLLAIEKAPAIGFGCYIVSATSPFEFGDLSELHQDGPTVVKRYVPEYQNVYAAQGWVLFPKIDRVYVNKRARIELGWEPRYSFAKMMKLIDDGHDYRSPLSRTIGSKGYHDVIFRDGPYPV